MKLNPNYIVHRTETETVLVPLGGSAFNGIGKGNSVLGVLLSLLEKESSEDELIAAMADRYDAPRDVIAADVRRTLSQLREIGAIED